MIKIYLTPDKFTLLDEKDYDYLCQWEWKLNRDGYAYRSLKGRNILIHRIITNATEGMEVDHKNGDRLDNRRENLRVVLPKYNRWNKGMRKDNTFGFKGVGYSKQKGRCRADIKLNGTSMLIGYFTSIEDASEAYDDTASKLFGEYNRLPEFR